MTIQPPDFIGRLKTEISELAAKHTALKNFIAENPVYKTLDEVDRGLMALQEHHMQSYINILIQRYDRLTLKVEPEETFPKADT